MNTLCLPGLVKFSSRRIQTKANTLLISRMYRTVELFRRITDALSSSNAATSVSSGSLKVLKMEFRTLLHFNNIYKGASRKDIRFLGR